MKLKSIIVSIAAAAALLCSCDKEKALTLSEVQLDKSYVTITTAGGTATMTVKATDSWEIKDVPNWLSVSPLTGSAGESLVTFSADKTNDGRSQEIHLVCAGKTQNIIVQQGLATVAKATCAEVAKGIEGKNYLVTGVCTAIANTSYGNWYLNDGTGEIYVYGTVNDKGSYAWNTFDIEIGDEVTVQGPMKNYNGTIELVDALFISVNKSLIKCDSLTVGGRKFDVLPIEGGDFVAELTNKGEGVTVDLPADAKSWLSITGVTTSGNTTKVSFTAAPNDGGDRSTTLVFKTSKSKKDYTAQTTLTQKGSILEVSIADFNAKEDGTAQYRISGIVSKKPSETDKYGTNIYIKDATGEAYIYGTADASGKAEKIMEKYGVKVGDVITMVGVKSSYKGAPQMVNGVFQADGYYDVTAISAADVHGVADSKTKYYLLTGTVVEPDDADKAAGMKADIETYGNFKLVDATGSVYVYGVSTGWNGESKKFGTLGVKYGDIITMVAYKTSYKGLDEVVGMYVSHEAAPAASEIVITDAKLPTVYPTEDAEISEGGYTYVINQVANFGDGIQFKKNAGYIYNKTATSKKIKSIKVVGSATKTFYNGNLSLYAGSAANPETKIESTAGTNEDVFDLSAGDYTYFKIAETSNHAVYLEKIVITLAD